MEAYTVSSQSGRPMIGAGIKVFKPINESPRVVLGSRHTKRGLSSYYINLHYMIMPEVNEHDQILRAHPLFVGGFPKKLVLAKHFPERYDSNNRLVLVSTMTGEQEVVINGNIIPIKLLCEPRRDRFLASAVNSVDEFFCPEALLEMWPGDMIKLILPTGQAFIIHNETSEAPPEVIELNHYNLRRRLWGYRGPPII